MISDFFKKIFKFVLVVLGGLLTVLFIWFIYVINFVETMDFSDDKLLELYPQGIYLDLDKTRIFYQHFATSSEKNIVIVGGTTAWSETWNDTIGKFKDTHNIYAIDMPPFGYSKVDDGYVYNLVNQSGTINRFVEKLNIKKPILISHSYGAGPSFEAVLRQPSNFKKIVIVDGAIHTEGSGHNAGINSEGSLPAKLLNVNTLKYFFTTSITHFPGFMQLSLEYLVYDPSQVTDWWVDTYTEPLYQKGSTKRLANWFYDFVFRNGDGLSRDSKNLNNLKLPVAIIWGQEDNLTPLFQAENLQKNIPNSKLIIMEKTGHIPMIDNKKEFLKILENALD